MDFDTEKIGRAVSSPFVVGALGALVGLRFVPGESFPARVFNLLNGSLMAGFGGPGLCEFLSLSSPAVNGAMYFAIGLFGMNFVAVAMRWLKQAQPSDFLPWIRRKE